MIARLRATAWKATTVGPRPLRRGTPAIVIPLDLDIPLTYPLALVKVELNWSAPMARTRLFRSNRSQAVRLPKDVAFPESVRDVTILREGVRRVIVPAHSMWDDFFDAPGIDLPLREQPRAQERDPL